jgi:hypothetical protein
MDSALFILARGAEDDIVKVVIGIIVFVIWGIGALAKLAKNQNKASERAQAEMDRAIRQQLEEARRRELAASLGQTGPMSPPPIPPALQRQRGPVVPPQRGQRVPFQSPGGTRTMPSAPRNVPAMRQPQPRQKKPKRRGPIPAMPVPAEELQELEPIPEVVESQIGQGTVAASPARRAAAASAASAKLLRLTPQSLRQQFILTEILQAPLALRDQPHRA